MEKQQITTKTVNKMRRIIFISILSIYSLTFYGQSTKSIVYNGEQLKNISINENVPMSNLYYQSADFLDVQKLGFVKKKDCKKSAVDEVCIFTFSNMEITYINLNGDFELSEITFFGKESVIKINGEKLTIGNKNVSLNQQRNTDSFLNNFIDGQGLTSQQKFEGGYTYMELFIDENDKIARIVYKRDLL